MEIPQLYLIAAFAAVSALPAGLFYLALRSNRLTVEGWAGQSNVRLWAPLLLYMLVCVWAINTGLSQTGKYNLQLSSSQSGRLATGNAIIIDRFGELSIDFDNVRWKDTGDFVFGPSPYMLDIRLRDGQIHAIGDWGISGIGWIHGFPGSHDRRVFRFHSFPSQGGFPLHALDEGVIYLDAIGFPLWLEVVLAILLASIGSTVLVLLIRRRNDQWGRSSFGLGVYIALTLLTLVLLIGSFQQPWRFSDPLPASSKALKNELPGDGKINIIAGAGDINMDGEITITLDGSRLNLSGNLRQSNWDWDSKTAALTPYNTLVFEYGSQVGEGDSGITILQLKGDENDQLEGGYMDLGGGYPDRGFMKIQQSASAALLE